MPIDFFDKEVAKAQQRFNQTFGRLTVCDLKLRQAVILTVCLLGRAGDKIKIAKNKDDVRGEIKKFIRIRTSLNKVFYKIEKQQKERRNNVSSNISERSCSNGRSDVG